MRPLSHDDGEKDYSRKEKASSTGEDVLDLAAGPSRMRVVYLQKNCGRGTPIQTPSRKSLKRLVKVWKKTGGEISAVMRAMGGVRPSFGRLSALGRCRRSPVGLHNCPCFRKTSIWETRCWPCGAKFPDEFTPLRKELRDFAGDGKLSHAQTGFSRCFILQTWGGWRLGPRLGSRRRNVRPIGLQTFGPRVFRYWQEPGSGGKNRPGG